MVCDFSTPGVVVCGPPRGVYQRTERDCPECGQRHGFVERWDGAWYGTTLYGSCGDMWMDGFRSRRPFARYWRRDAQQRFQLMWDNAAQSDLFDAYTNADMQMACANDDDAAERAFNDRQAAHEAILAAREVTR